MPDDEPPIHLCLFWREHLIEVHIDVRYEAGVDPIEAACSAIREAMILSLETANALTRGTSIQ